MRLRNKRVIVTGGAGFIGSHVVDQLVAAQNDVMVIDDFSTGKWENLDHHRGNPSVHIEQADIRNVEAMIHLTQGMDVVIHMAVACLRVSLHDPMLVHEINATGTLNMCRASLEAGVERFICVSSSEAYGSALTVPMDEEHPLNPTTVYGASKAASELYALAYWRSYGLPVVIVRPFNTYGPREPSEGKRAEVIPKFVMRAMAGLQPVVFGAGDQTRDFTWVEDSARGIIMAAECDDLVGDCVNIARGQEASILNVCELVLERLGREELKPLYLDDGRPGDVQRHYADIRRARRLLGFSPSVDLESGLDRYIQWVKAQDPDLESWVEQDRTRNW
ncbi:MAG: SDR family NAD(P)-dependent oxidoreductase [Anaerolineae bacterium]|jgi:UDP-glucose 4-epimerase